jgi:hypothetical protein
MYGHLCLDLGRDRDRGFIVVIDPWIVGALLQID